MDREFETLGQDELVRLHVSGSAPSLLGPLGLARDELKHSRLLAWFLSQRDSVGGACRRPFLEYVGLGGTVSMDGWRVSLERNLAEHGRLDVHIEVSREATIYVEVKVDAPERENQLRSGSGCGMDSGEGSTQVLAASTSISSWNLFRKSSRPTSPRSTAFAPPAAMKVTSVMPMTPRIRRRYWVAMSRLRIGEPSV